MKLIFEFIDNVGTPIALVAFFLAVALYIYKHRVNGKLNLIKSAPEKDRSKLIEASMETYHLTNDNLTKDMKYNLVIKVIEEKRKRLTIYIIALITLAVIISAALLMGNHQKNNSTGNAAKIGCIEIKQIEIEVGKSKEILKNIIVSLTQADEKTCTVVIGGKEYEVAANVNENILLNNCNHTIRRISYNSSLSTCTISILEKIKHG